MRTFIFLLLSLIPSGAIGKSINQHSYVLKAEIPIRGQGGWDDLSVEPISHRLFVSHFDRVVVIDTKEGKVLHEILDTPGVHGIALAPDLKKAFTSNGKEGKVSVIDLETLNTKAKIKVGENPDAIVYEPSRQEVYVFNGRSKSVSIIDAKKEEVITTLELPGKPEFATVDPGTHRVFVNIEDKDSVVALDTQNHKIAATWKLEKCESPSGIAIDLKKHRVFSVCENEKMAILDTQSGHTIATVATGKGTDGAAFDPTLLLAFSSNGKSGSVTVVQEKSTDQFTVLQSLKTQLGARTMTLNPQDHRLYLPTADFQPSKNGERPKPIDGTQKILVYGPSED